MARGSKARMGGRIRRSPVIAGAVVLAAGAALVFEQSPANEMLRTSVALDVLKSTGSALWVGAVVAAITAAIEFGSSLLITLGLHAEEGRVQRLKERAKARLHPSGSDRASAQGQAARAGTDLAVALGLGAGLVTVRHHIADPEPTISKDLALSAKATAVVAGVSGLIGYLAGGGINQAAKIGLETPARYVIDYGTDTRFWLALLMGGYGLYFAVRLTRRAARHLAVTPVAEPEAP